MSKKIVCILVIMCLLLTACNTRWETKPATSSDFLAAAMELGYDITFDEEYVQAEESVENVTIAYNNEGKFQVEFYTLISKEEAENFFLINKADLRSNCLDDKKVDTSSVYGISKFIGSNDDMYYLLIQEEKRGRRGKS